MKKLEKVSIEEFIKVKEVEEMRQKQHENFASLTMSLPP